MTGSSVIRSQGAKRYNHFTGRSVFISTVRGGRPDKKKTSAQHPVVQRDPFVDPQAFGNEDPVFQYTDPETQDWLLQIIPNLWPLVSPEWKDRFANEAIIDEGFHELLISKDPAYSFAEFSQEYIELVLEALRIRSEEILRQDPSIQEISMFQSYGLQAGGSQPHPHIHLFAHRDASSEVMLRRLMMHRFYDEHRVSLLDATLQEADAEPRLVVYHNDSYAVVCASAPSAAYDLQVLPTPSESHSYAPKGFFADILYNKKRKDLAMALHVATRVLKIALNDPPYNILFRNLSSEGDPPQDSS